MRIVLDTNIIEGDPALTSTRFQILLRHSQGTGARFTMPRIVLEELPVVRKRRVTELLKKFREAAKNLSNGLINQTVPEFEVNLETIPTDFVENIRKVLNIEDSDIAEFKDGYLADVVRRAVNRIPPCSAQGEEIRDAILWLSVLDAASAEMDRKVIFISTDSAFHDGKEKLRPELIAEAEEKLVDVEYYTSLRDFAEHHKVSKASMFINKAWISERVRVKDVLTLANEDIDEEFQSTISWDLSFHRRGDSLSPTGYLQEISSTVELTSFFVNELSNDEFRVEACYQGAIEYEVEFEYYEDSEWGRPGQWKIDPNTGDMEFEPVDPPDREIKTQMLYPCVSVDITVEILVNEGEVSEFYVIST